VITVLSWFAARLARKPLQEQVAALLRPEPTLFAFLADRYSSETSLRPFAPLADRLADRMHVLLLAEWPQEERERDGEALLGWLGVSREAWPMLLRDEDEETRMAVVLRQRQPIALINLFFKERRRGVGDEIDRELCAWEDEAAEKLEALLAKLSPVPPPPPRALREGEHDWMSNGLCRRCGQGAGTLLGCGTKRAPEEGPRRDRFELIELE
jgi:hypothetical protein